MVSWVYDKICGVSQCSKSLRTRTIKQTMKHICKKECPNIYYEHGMLSLGSAKLSGWRSVFLLCLLACCCCAQYTHVHRLLHLQCIIWLSPVHAVSSWCCGCITSTWPELWHSQMHESTVTAQLVQGCHADQVMYVRRCSYRGVQDCHDLSGVEVLLHT